jgi:vanillate O-demethylase ferredoxin subunit
MTDSTFTVHVVRKQMVAHDIVAFDLQATNGAALPAFDAGAHIDVHLPNGLVRQYSLCNDPRERGRYQICVLRDPASRGGSGAMHDLVDLGAALRISAPRNLFALAPGPHASLLLAGGIGITPMLAMAWHLHAQALPFQLHYFSRSRARTAFHDEIKAAPFSATAALWFDDGDQPRPAISALLADAAPGTHIYACGPAGFLEHVRQCFADARLSAGQLHIEAFSAAPMAPGAAFDVTLRSSGKTVHVPEEVTVVEALAAHGITIPVSCEQGICGTCITRVCAGRPDHRDQYLSNAEHTANDQFTPCCSRALTPVLVLDL